MHNRSVGTCLLALLAVGAAACSSDDTDPDGGPADSGTGSDADGAVDVPDGAPGDAATGDRDAGPPDAGVDPADAAPQPDAAIAQCGRIRCDCTFNGIALFGRVEYVDNFADIQVSVGSFPDLRVREGNFADDCGEWEIVEAFPDFTVEIVDAFEDFEIEYSAFPGIP